MNVEKLAYRPNEIAEILGVSHQTVRRAIKDGKLSSFMIGSARLVSKRALDKYLAELQSQPYRSLNQGEK